MIETDNKEFFSALEKAYKFQVIPNSMQFNFPINIDCSSAPRFM